MPVTDFECQIARGQIDRYLGGGLLSQAALSGLEEHLAECAECKSIVSERRATLLGKLGGETPTHAVVSMPKKEREENPLIAALRAKAEQATQTEEPKPVTKAAPRYAKGNSAAPAGKPVLTKPIMLAGLLAVVLVGMNAMSRANGGKGVMGGKAADSFAAATLPSTETKPSVTETPKTGTAENKAPKIEAPKEGPAPKTAPAATPIAAPIEEPLVENTAVEKTPVKQPVPENAVAPIAPKVTATKPVARPRARRAIRRKASARKTRVASREKAARKIAAAPHSGVRVYSPDGQPLD